MTDKTKKAILAALFIVSFACFTVCSASVLILFWQNPSMTERELFISYPIPMLFELLSATIMTVCIIKRR